MFRKTVFWIHLICGVATGLVVLMMSVTGVILTYERQMIAWQTNPFYSDPPAAASRLSIESLAASASLADPGFVPTSVRLDSDPRAPAMLSAGRAGTRYVNTYTGEVLGEPPRGLEDFFGAVTGWHRWFNATGESRAAWRAVTGISNLAFLFLIVSGLYLWLPRVYKWAMFKSHLAFNKHALKGKARDYNWHHVFGFWTAIPLFVVVATAVVFSYPWASNAVYRAFGEEPPAGRGPPPPAAQGSVAAAPGSAAGNSGSRAPMPLDSLFDRAASQVDDDWQTITVNLPQPGATTVSFAIDQGNGGQPQLRHSLTLDSTSGKVKAWAPFESQTPGRRARSWVRFLHTGEALGIVGQTIAGLVSLTSVIMVWTGLALAYRRLIVPLFRQKS
ncbi:MAG: PepSY-associated TM helix domain-containing protein [Gammaproteobacteria bacterium]